MTIIGYLLRLSTLNMVNHRIESIFDEEESRSHHIKVKTMKEIIIEPYPSTSSTPIDFKKQEIEQKGKTKSNDQSKKSEEDESGTDKETVVFHRFMTTLGKWK